jgi:transcriptional regulator GlxA family with amidase domain
MVEARGARMRRARFVAADCGFGNPARMKRAFERELGMSPRDYRVMHGS